MQSVNTRRRPSAVSAAMEFIQGALANGPVPSADLLVSGGRAGYAQRTLRRAAQALGVRVTKERGPRGRWWWRMPETLTAGESYVQHLAEDVQGAREPEARRPDHADRAEPVIVGQARL